MVTFFATIGVMLCMIVGIFGFLALVDWFGKVIQGTVFEIITGVVTACLLVGFIGLLSFAIVVYNSDEYKETRQEFCIELKNADLINEKYRYYIPHQCR